MAPAPSIRRRNARRGALLLAMLLASGLCSVQARVFSRWRAGTDVAMLMRPLDARLLYAAPVTLNGTPGDLSVYGAGQPLDRVQRDLRTLLPHAEWSGGDSLAFATVHDGDSVLRLLMTQPEPLGPAVIFALHQAAGDARTGTPPPLPVIPGLSIPAGVTPHYVAQDLHAGASLLILQSAAALADARAIFNGALNSGGWAPIVPPDAAPTGLTFYRRGDDILVLAASAGTANAPATTITVLHKRPGMK